MFEELINPASRGSTGPAIPPVVEGIVQLPPDADGRVGITIPGFDAEIIHLAGVTPPGATVPAIGSIVPVLIVDGRVPWIIGSEASAVPSGPAGGDLAGTYPDPTIAPDSVDYAKRTVVPYARLRRTTDLSVAHNTLTLVGGMTVEEDTTGGTLTGTADKLTLDRAGVWGMFGAARWVFNATGERECGVALNGTISSALFPGQPPTDTGRQAAWRALSFSSGDTLELAVRQNSGGPLDLRAESLSSILECVYLGRAA